MAESVAEKRARAAVADGTLLLLLSMNLLLLALFIMLNSLATQKDAAHAKNVLARMREGYDLRGTATEEGTLPWDNKDQWQQEAVSRMQGVVLNRLNLQTVPLKDDADHMVLRLPLAALFDDKGTLTQPEVVRNLTAAAGLNAFLQWKVYGDLRANTLQARMMVELAAVTGAAQALAGEPQVELVMWPGNATPPSVGTVLQRAGEAVGAGVKGVKDVR